MALQFDVRPQTVSQWIARRVRNGFPMPLPELYMAGRQYGRRYTQVWDGEEVTRWRETYQPLQGAAAHGNSWIKR